MPVFNSGFGHDERDQPKEETKRRKERRSQLSEWQQYNEAVVSVLVAVVVATLEVC